MGVHKIPRLTDRDIAAKLEVIQADIADGHMSPVHFGMFGQGISGVVFPSPTHEAWQRVLEGNGSAVETFGLSFNGVTLHYHRGGTNNERSPYFDEISITLQDADPHRMQQAAELTALFRPVNVPPPPNDDPGAAYRALQEARIGQLEQVLRDAVERAAEHNDDVEKRFLARVDDLDAQYVKRREELQAEVDGAREELRAEEAALEARKKALDDRGNTHARRDIRDRMLADVQARIGRFGVSQSTETKRRPVQVGIFILASLLAFFAVTTIIEIGRFEDAKYRTALAMAAASKVAAGTTAASTSATGLAPATTNPASAAAASVAALTEPAREAVFDPAIYWAAWVRLTLLSFGLVATLVYYIRWQNQWAERHSQSEFALQQFQLDVNRANWVLESCLEWRKETASTIPRELLSSITRGLFVPAEAPAEPALNPADELAKAILGSSSKLRLKAGDSELEVDKPGKIKPPKG